VFTIKSSLCFNRAFGHGQAGSNPSIADSRQYFRLVDDSEVDPPLRTEGVVIMFWPITDHSSAARVPDNDHPAL